MKKLALVLIPDTPANVNRREYIKDCMAGVTMQGFMPLLYELYKEYSHAPYTDFIKTALTLVDTALIYQDFNQGEALQTFVRSQGFTGEIIETRLETYKEYIRTLEDILKEVAIKRNIQVRDLKGPSKRRELVDTRYIFFRRAKKCTEATLGMIGQTVDRDHSTVLHGLREMEQVRELQILYRTHYGDEHEA
jgi:hypothetical protein